MIVYLAFSSFHAPIATKMCWYRKSRLNVDHGEVFWCGFCSFGNSEEQIAAKYRELSVLQHVDHRVGRLLPLFNGFGALVTAVIFAATAK